MTEEKVTAAAAPKEATAPREATTTERVSARKPTLVVNVENVGFRADDICQTLVAADKALSITEVARAARIGTEEVYLGIGWLFKESKVKGSENLLTLA